MHQQICQSYEKEKKFASFADKLEHRLDKSFMEEMENPNKGYQRQTKKNLQAMLFQNSYSHLSNLRSNMLKNSILKDGLLKLGKTIDIFYDLMVQIFKEYLAKEQLTEIFYKNKLQALESSLIKRLGLVRNIDSTIFETVARENSRKDSIY